MRATLTTITGWKKNCVKIKKWCSNLATSSGLKKTKTINKSDYEEVGNAMILWFFQIRKSMFQ